MVTNKAIRKTSTVIICSIMQNARICQGMLCDKNKNRNSEDTGNERINLLYMSVSISLYKSTRVESLVDSSTVAMEWLCVQDETVCIRFSGENKHRTIQHQV